MAIFAGNLSFKISSELRSRVFLTPWVNKARVIRCCRDYQSSGPVRYIPKKYSKIEETQTSPRMKSSEETQFDECSDSISLRERVSPRISNLGKSSQNQFSYFDRIPDAETVNSDKFGNVTEFLEFDDEDAHEPEEVIDELRISCEIEPCEGDAKRTNKTKKDAEKIAFEALAARAFTATELRKKLLGKRFPLDIIEGVVTDLQSRGLINDYLYAEAFSQSKWSSSTWGPRRIKQALLQKGVSEANAEKAMKHVFEDGGSDGDKEPILGMSKLSMDRLFVQASKQWLRGQDVPCEKRKSRIVRWLQYRGFNWGVIGFVLKKLESKYPP